MSSHALSNREEESLLKEAKANALKQCDDIVKEFAACSTGRTITVAWACRGQHRKLQDCLKDYTGEEAMSRRRQKFLQESREQ